jgi:hypothetical protein
MNNTVERTNEGFWTTEADGKRFYYTIRIDENGFHTLRWLSARGYDCGLEDALMQHPACTEGEYAIPEHKIHDVYDQAQDENAGFACLDWQSEIGQEIRRLIESVV